MRRTSLCAGKPISLRQPCTLPMTRRNNHSLTYPLALLLLCSLLVAQWAGLHHRVAHAGVPPSDAAHLALDRFDLETSDHSLFHSCLLLDAATVGLCIASADYVVDLQGNLPRPILIVPPVSWQAFFIPQFSSRAPPLSILA